MVSVYDEKSHRQAFRPIEKFFWGWAAIKILGFHWDRLSHWKGILQFYIRALLMAVGGILVWHLPQHYWNWDHIRRTNWSLTQYIRLEKSKGERFHPSGICNQIPKEYISKSMNTVCSSTNFINFTLPTCKKLYMMIA